MTAHFLGISTVEVNAVQFSRGRYWCTWEPTCRIRSYIGGIEYIRSGLGPKTAPVVGPFFIMCGRACWMYGDWSGSVRVERVAKLIGISGNVGC
jgi:hypothetical protein